MALGGGLAEQVLGPGEIGLDPDAELVGLAEIEQGVGVAALGRGLPLADRAG
jgi:hypothetical protein